MDILLVEDDAAIADFLQEGLQDAGFRVDHAADGERGLDLALTESYNLAVVDIMLPGLDGITLIERLRENGITTPVMILSARRSVDDRVHGLRRGGDDYLTKPFAYPELLARIEAMLRRSSGRDDPRFFSLGPLYVDRISRQVARDGRAIELQPREYALLEHLMRHSGSVVSRKMILEHVWGFEFDPQTNVVDVLVHRLRKRIDDGFDPALIHTVRGVGYVLRIP